jgi:Uma2 family endonuclease
MTLILNNPAKPHVKRWTKGEYNHDVERGLFDNKRRVFLYRGELIEMPSMGALHVQAVKRLGYFLHEHFRPAHEVRMQMPFECVDESMPEPDAGVFTVEQDARRPHPNAALWLIEVADSSIELDREMALDYAAAQVREYWILNVADRVIEVYRDPVADATAALGYRYATHRIYSEGDEIASLLAPDKPVQVAKLVAVE